MERSSGSNIILLTTCWQNLRSFLLIIQRTDRTIQDSHRVNIFLNSPKEQHSKQKNVRKAHFAFAVISWKDAGVDGI